MLLLHLRRPWAEFSVEQGSRARSGKKPLRMLTSAFSESFGLLVCLVYYAEAVRKHALGKVILRGRDVVWWSWAPLTPYT